MTCISNRSVRTSASRSCLAYAPTTNSTAPWSVTSEVQNSDIFQGWSSSDQNNTRYQQGEDTTLRAQQRGSTELGRVVVGTSTAINKIQWVLWNAVYMRSYTRSSDATSSSEASVSEITNYFIYRLPFPQPEFAGFNSAWPALSCSPRSRVHGACDSTLESHLDLPDPYIVSSSFDATATQQNSCCVHSQQPSEMNHSVCTQCLGRRVPPHQIHASSSCRELRLNRYVHATEVGTPFPCCSWTPYAAAQVAAYNSASPLEKEMTPCFLELVSSTDFPSLITTQELLMRSVSFAAQSLPANTSRYSSSALAGNDHARCGLCTRYRTTRRARASVPRVTRVISLVRFLTKHRTSSLSAAK